MDRPSLKKEIIRMLVVLDQLEGQENGLVYLATPLGLITGSTKPLEDTSHVNDKILLEAVNIKVKKYFADYDLPEDKRLNGDDGYFALYDVTVKSNGITYNMPFMILFYDQIIGVSFGSSALS